MKSDHSAYALFLPVPALVFLVLLLSGCGRYGQEVPGSPTPDATAEAASAALVDDFGPAALDYAFSSGLVATGTPRVLLSQKVSAAQLVCLGLGWAHWENHDQAVKYELVVYEGQLAGFATPGGRGPRIADSRYLLRVFDKGVMTAGSGPDWGRLRHTYGSSALPTDHPLYVSPEGIPSLADLAPEEPAYPTAATVSNLVWGREGQELNVSQSRNGWTVSVARVYATTSWVILAFTVSGPDRTYTVEAPGLTTPDGVSLTSNFAEQGGTFDGTYVGPNGFLVAFRAQNSPISPSTRSLRFEVPAIHVRSVFTPCNTLADTILPTPTRIPHNIMEILQNVTPQPTPPDLEVVGPFTFDLQVPVVPSTPTPVLPTAIPTQPSDLPPLPVPTGT